MPFTCMTISPLHQSKVSGGDGGVDEPNSSPLTTSHEVSKDADESLDLQGFVDSNLNTPDDEVRNQGQNVHRVYRSLKERST